MTKLLKELSEKFFLVHGRPLNFLPKDYCRHDVRDMIAALGWYPSVDGAPSVVAEPAKVEEKPKRKRSKKTTGAKTNGKATRTSRSKTKAPVHR